MYIWRQLGLRGRRRPVCPIADKRNVYADCREYRRITGRGGVPRLHHRALQEQVRISRHASIFAPRSLVSHGDGKETSRQKCSTPASYDPSLSCLSCPSARSAATAPLAAVGASMPQAAKYRLSQAISMQTRPMKGLAPTSCMARRLWPFRRSFPKTLPPPRVAE
jgi:hypothetical protein